MKGIILGILALLIMPMFVMASVPLVPFSGTVGGTTDAGASSGLWYLRHVGDPAPAGYSHAYQWGTPAITCDPNNAPVVFAGTIDVSSMVVGDVSLIGLIDKDLMAAGKTGYQSGAYVYVYKNTATTVRIGPSDGNLGGEIVSTFADFDVSTDSVLDIVLTISAGQVSVAVDGNTAMNDIYGVKKGTFAYAWNEFANGAYPGWDNYPTTSRMPFDFGISGCQAEAGNEVPEFGLIAGAVALAGLVAGVVVLRKRD